MTKLEIEDLAKAYGDQKVLAGLSLVVAAGSFASILGPSGSGKTTLLRLIAGFERADRGTIRLGGELVDDGDARFVSAEQRHLGYVPQEGALFPHLSVQQNVGFGLPRRERRGERVGELLEMVGLSGFERRYPHQLSGGQQQRVALARALAIQPKVVLLDEPFSSLDASLRASVRRDVRRVLRESGTTAVLVTHDQDEALSLADTVAVLKDGRIGQFGAPRELYMRPTSPEIAVGIGESNLVPALSRGATADTPLGQLVLDNGPFANGAPIHVLVRPEQIELVHELTDGLANSRVLEAEYYGHDAVVRLRAGWDATFTVVVRISDAASLPTIDTPVRLRAKGSVVGWADDPTWSANAELSS